MGANSCTKRAALGSPKRGTALSAEQGKEQGEEVLGEKLGAFRRGMDAVVLNGAGDRVDAGVQLRQQGHVILCRDQPVGFIKLADVVGAVVGGQGNAGEENPAVSAEQGADDGVEITAGGVDGDTAEAVIAAEFDNGDGGVKAEEVFQAVHSVFAGIAADAGVDDPVMVSAGVEEGLKVCGIGVGWIDAMPGGDAVAEAIEDGFGPGWGNGMVLRGVKRYGEDESGGQCREAAQHSLSLAMSEAAGGNRMLHRDAKSYGATRRAND